MAKLIVSRRAGGFNSAQSPSDLVAPARRTDAALADLAELGHDAAEQKPISHSATDAPTTSVMADVPLAHTRVSRAFAGLLRDLDACIHTEAPLQRGVADIFAPEFDAALAKAETARAHLMVRLDHLIDLPAQRAADHPLRLMALFLRTLLAIEDDEDRAYIHATVAQHAHLLDVAGADPSARRLRGLQSHFFSSCDTLMRLEDFNAPGPDNDGDGGPAMAA
jgi:hypothetical protein